MPDAKNELTPMARLHEYSAAEIKTVLEDLQCNGALLACDLRVRLKKELRQRKGERK